ncbi:hypothetical protein TNCV_3643601 [Trichonephila clavipes]|nr:hypothetical protein TNCV_3643601 [Trichonephila clavipes]
MRVPHHTTYASLKRLRVTGSVVVLFFLMPPVERSQIEAHGIHRGKGLEVRLSLALSTIQVTVRISSAKFPEGTIDGDTTNLHLHNLGIELKGSEIFSSPPAFVIQPTQNFRTHSFN